MRTDMSKTTKVVSTLIGAAVIAIAGVLTYECLIPVTSYIGVLTTADGEVTTVITDVEEETPYYDFKREVHKAMATPTSHFVIFKMVHKRYHNVERAAEVISVLGTTPTGLAVIHDYGHIHGFTLKEHIDVNKRYTNYYNEL